GLKWVSGFEKDIQRPVQDTEVRPLFHLGFERAEDLVDCHRIVHGHLVAEGLPFPDGLQNILSRDLPFFGHAYSTRKALTLPAPSAGNASLTTVRTPRWLPDGRSNAITPWAA